ncbi:hypothetical protein FACS189494_04700 [Spirochaetia bacterium]|nr:hypothetical protein FACS189494_04700 [Spirochaetia bacterium]
MSKGSSGGSKGGGSGKSGGGNGGGGRPAPIPPGKVVMKTVVLISCVKTKKEGRQKASDLFSDSTFFNLALEYANSINPSEINILSSKYHLISLNEYIQEYDVSLSKMSELEKRGWANKVLKQLSKKYDLENDNFIFLTFCSYSRYLIKHVRNYITPLEGLNRGQQLRWLREACENAKK